MRSKRWFAAILVVGGLVLVGSLPAEGGSPGSFRSDFAAYAAPACGAPGYGMMVPGCCECPPTCCDHVWDGYCQEKGHRTWHRVKPCGVSAGGACQPCLAVPLPAGPVRGTFAWPQPAGEPPVVQPAPPPKAPATAAPAPPTAP